ncbi:hypothetical protein IV203_005804 [Nitzschia inconspicua]|uniref:Uncharacterized protein n=1 Tax=Nitzschia inconspicua TaxID=303405 RepID=A0A9K3PGV6_9STRA|nr:hypothetical protein IV203_005804 [Nitzschia inconspicua]
MSSTDRLILSQEQMSDKLYDAESMMQIKSTVANGYAVLLNNGAISPKNNGKKKEKSPKKKKQDDSTSLAFLALTSGNVLDACFGVEQASRTGDSPARRKAQAAKDLLDGCSTTDSFQDLAVETYYNAFKIVIEYNEQMSKLNCFTRCFKAKKIQTETEQKLNTTFSRLAEAIGEKR